MRLKKDVSWSPKKCLHLPYDQMLKALNIPFTHPEGLFAPNTYFFAKGETDRKNFNRFISASNEIIG